MPRDGKADAKRGAGKARKAASGRLKRKPDPAGHPELPKVFCIGFHKTGTTSLKSALKLLDYRVTGPNGRRDRDIANNVEDLARRLVPKFDAFQDNPWPVIYRFLDKEFPGSKFILTIRPTENWIASIRDHFSKGSPPMREWIYGPGRANPIGNEEIYVERYERHNREVQEYFAERSGDFIVFDLAEGDGWLKLCAFLGHPIPELPFPWRNSKEKREKRVAKHGTRAERRKARRASKPAPPGDAATAPHRQRRTKANRAAKSGRAS
jgi:hypothetical protein